MPEENLVAKGHELQSHKETYLQQEIGFYPIPARVVVTTRLPVSGTTKKARRR